VPERESDREVYAVNPMYCLNTFVALLFTTLL
jgi:hypothetical protein